MTEAEALAALQAALVECQAAGIGVQIGPLYHSGFGMVHVILENVEVRDGLLIPARQAA
jgi:hypothetical protein